MRSATRFAPLCATAKFAERVLIQKSHCRLMHVTDLALNQALGMRLVPPDRTHILEMSESPLLLNHLGTIHASAQFALAEAASGEFLLRHWTGDEKSIIAVLRISEVKFRKPARGQLRASARFADGAGDFAAELSSRGRALASVLIEVADAQGVITMSGRYDWFLQQQAHSA
jgi:hypothetical protein